MSLSVRRAQAADAEALTEVMHASSAYAGEHAAILDGYVVTPAQIERDLVHVAEASGRIAGFYSLILGAEPELDLMFVADAAQGQGVGRRLLEHMASTAREHGIGQVRIVSHPPSVGFYERMGARAVCIKPPSGRVTWARPVLLLEIDS